MRTPGQAARWWRRAILIAASGCAASSPSPDGALLGPARYQSLGADVQRRVLDSPHALLRVTNVPFSQRICERFDRDMRVWPLVNLHGDAHLEQFAVTSRGYGLVDFDDSSLGPALIDLVRFATSIGVTCHERGWGDRQASLVAEFLRGYRDALESHEVVAPEPACVDEVRAGWTDGRQEFLDWASSRMQPLDQARQTWFDEGFARYVALLTRRRPELTPAYLVVKEAGQHSMGVGSATTFKILARIEGPTPSPEDDVILEIKEVRDLSGIDCVIAHRGDALRVIVARARIGRGQDPFLAVVPRGPEDTPDDPPFWIQSWLANYEALDILHSLPHPQDLQMIGYAVGVQLGHGHTNGIAAPYDADLRDALGALVERYEPAIQAAAQTFTAETIAAWRSTRARYTR